MHVGKSKTRVLWGLLLSGLIAGPCAVRSHAADWKKFTSEKGDFSIMLPGTPTEQTGTSNTKGDTHIFDLNKGVVDYSIIYIDFDESVTWMSPDQVLNGFVNAGIKGDKKNKVLGERHITLGEYPGRAVTYQTPDGVVAKARVYLVKQRLYQETVVATAKDINAKETDDFLGSLQFLGKYQPPASKVEWKTFAPEKEGFSVLMPGTPKKEEDPPIPTDYGQVKSYSYMAMSGAGIFGVSYSDYPVSITQVDAKKVLDGERDRILKGSKLKLISEKDVVSGDTTGRELQLETPEGMVSKGRLYLAKQRLFQVMVVTSKARAEVPEAQQDASKFLDSFQLLPTP